MKSSHYNVFVIGSGVAGQTVAKTCSKKGLKVAIAEKEKLGGVCALRGCDPKKVMMQFAEIIKKTQQLKGLGFTNLPKVNWQQIVDYKNTFTEEIPKSTKENLTEIGIDIYNEPPKFIDENTIEIEQKKITADHFVIATGLTPRILDIKGKEFLKISDAIFNLPSIPKSIIFIGSGYIGMEFAFMFAALGSKVTVLDKGREILSQFDKYLTDKIKTSLEKMNVDFIFNAESTAIEKDKNELVLHYKIEEEKYQLKATEIFNTSGRVPSVKNLDLEKANIKSDESGITVNDFLKSTTNSKIFACGDVSNKSLPLTPLSGLQGYIVAQNILEKNSKKFKNPLVASTVFTHPNIARVGLSEKKAKENCNNLKIYKGDATNWYNAKKENAGEYAYKFFVDADLNKILGAEVLGTATNETINIIALTMEQNVKVDDLKKMIFTYPSYAYDLKKMLKDDK